jgi:hypothetical protein
MMNLAMTPATKPMMIVHRMLMMPVPFDLVPAGPGWKVCTPLDFWCRSLDLRLEEAADSLLALSGRRLWLASY